MYCTLHTDGESPFMAKPRKIQNSNKPHKQNYVRGRIQEKIKSHLSFHTFVIYWQESKGLHTDSFRIRP